MADTGMWVAGWNTPGYLPEMEPTTFATFEEAKRFLIAEITEVGDNLAAEGRDEAFDAAEREQVSTEAEELSALAEDLNLERRTGDPLGSGLGTLIGDDYSEWSAIANGTAYWVRFEELNVRHVSVFRCDEVDTLCVLWHGALTFNVHAIDPYTAEGLDIGREVDVFSAEGPEAPTMAEASDTCARWFVNYLLEG